ncbi:MAG: MMPL family transporter [Aquabacterium sp.]
MTGTKGRIAVVAVWLLSLLMCGVVILRTQFVADLSAFMPKITNARQQMLIDQFRDGIVARLIMVGIEGGDAATRARVSLELGRQLRQDDAFLHVQNGDAATQDKDQALFFDNRYLLSPAVTAQRFTAQGLHEAIGDAIASLSGSAGLMLKSVFPRDPTGEILAVMEGFAGDSQPPTQFGAWSSRDGKRAILLLQTRAAGSDTDAQSAAIDRIRQAFAQVSAKAPGTRLVMSGTGVFSVSSRATIEHEVERLATASVVLVAGMLLVVYRSLWLLTIGLLPVLTGGLVGVAAVSLGFGHVHGLTLGFGTTLIGEAVDYAIYLFMQRAAGHEPDSFWRTVRLGVLTSAAGFSAMLFSGFPGLSQLGLYSVSGLIAAALVTRYVLPLMLPEKLALRDLTRTGEVLDMLFAKARGFRWLLAGVTLAALGFLLWQHDAVWSRQLAALSPISKADQALDVSLRDDLGASDMRYVASFTAADEQAALQQAEKAAGVLNGFVQDGMLGGFKSPSMVLPSLATQQRRQAALPDAAQAAVRLDEALKGLPVKADKLKGFLADLQAAKARGPLTRAELHGTAASMLVDSLLIRREHDYLVLMPLRSSGVASHGDEIDVPRLSAGLTQAGLANVAVIDILTETTNIFDSYLHEALLMAGAGGLVIVLLLFAALRDVRRTLKVALPLACAVVCVAASLVLGGHQLTILHLVGLLLVVAVGSNYALFFDGAMLDKPDRERRQTQTSLVVANLATVGSFGLLGLSSVPVLGAIGGTVGIGAFLALLFSAMLAG